MTSDGLTVIQVSDIFQFSQTNLDAYSNPRLYTLDSYSKSRLDWMIIPNPDIISTTSRRLPQVKGEAGPDGAAPEAKKEAMPPWFGWENMGRTTHCLCKKVIRGYLPT